MEAPENKGPDQEQKAPEETAKSSRRKRRARTGVKPAGKDAGDGDSCFMGSCAKLRVKSIWVVGIAGIVLVTIFCFAMVGNPGKPARKVTPLAAQPVAMTLPREGFMPYQMDPVLQWGMQGMQPAASYGPNCPPYPNAVPVYPQPGPFQQTMPAPGPYYGNNANGIFCYPQSPALQQVAAQQGMLQAPPIFRDAVMKHEYRGVCENCHKVL